MDTALIKIWDTLVGAVTWNSRMGYGRFEYDSNFKKEGIDLAPLKMPVNTNQSIFSFPALRKKVDGGLDTFKGLPGLLADVLPDRYGNELINLWLAQQGRPMDSMNPVETLCFIGSRGMGALEFEPLVLKENKNNVTLEIDSLVNIANKVLSAKKFFSTNLKSDEAKALLDILKVGTSAGGARPKALIAYNKRTGEVKSGQASAPKGFEHWLLKLDGVSAVQLGATHGYGRVEMAYYNMATACGITIMPSQLLEENGRAHFMTKRFDRMAGSVKHHVQTFCAMQHFDFNFVNSFSYEQLFQTLRMLRLTYADAEQLFRRMVFNVLAKNCDDHTKNFAFILKQGGSWALAPAYDICHAYQPQHQWVSQHALSVNGKRENITMQDFITVAELNGIKKAETIVNDIYKIVSDWKAFATEVKVAPKLTKAIEATLVKL
jgi:serine/threonine-protein kinase HipA